MFDTDTLLKQIKCISLTGWLAQNLRCCTVLSAAQIQMNPEQATSPELGAEQASATATIKQVS